MPKIDGERSPAMRPVISPGAMPATDPGASA
jgi:hypothetical protein